ncbi:MAG: SurA N-terminal domain-containing protein [Candidatus Adiutrix sp.]|jgi:hypothetical protein|nr:SurA N-terminal domain-containing protein [Candidatus Adiutrix sp.]
MPISFRFSFIAALGLALALMAPPELEANDRIVAAVNGDIITERQLDNRVNSLVRSRRAGGAARAEIRRRVLDALIEQELVAQEARRKGVFVSEADVKGAIDMIKKENKINDAQLRAGLAYSGITLEAFKQDIAAEILKSKVLGSQIMSRIVVTDKEVLAFLRGEGPNLDSPPLAGTAPGGSEEKGTAAAGTETKKGPASLSEYGEEARNNARLQLERYKMQQRYIAWMADLKSKAVIRISL